MFIVHAGYYFYFYLFSYGVDSCVLFGCQGVDESLNAPHLYFCQGLCCAEFTIG